MFRNIFYGAYCICVLFCKVDAMDVERTQEIQNVHIADVQVDTCGDTFTSMDAAFTQKDNDPYGEHVVSALTGVPFTQDD